VASTRVPADFRILIWGTVAAGIAALLAPVLGAVSNFYGPTPLRRSRSDSTACLEKTRRRPNTTARRRSFLAPGRKPLTGTRTEHSCSHANPTARIVAVRQGAS
jgi:hypothetical protein